MKIQDSVINTQGNHQLSERKNTEETLKVWVDQAPMTILEISQEAKGLFLQSSQSVQRKDSEESIELSISEKDKQKILLLEKFIEKLTGKKVKFYILENIKLDSSSNNKHNSNGIGNTHSAGQHRQGWGIEYHYHEFYQEKETMSFSANGIVTTEDGKKIDISVQLNMSREFVSQTNIDFRAGDAVIDPLVIHFDGTTPTLTEDKYSFDIDLDGSPDQISFVGSGSGFLALDQNNDGVINDGKELFGPSTGSGFDELRKYDEDHNQWIDENDPIFEKLRIWTKDENGNDYLFALGQKGIGAIYLGNITTAFQIKDSQNELLGNIQSSSIFLKENGSAGIIQQIDLAI